MRIFINQVNNGLKIKTLILRYILIIVIMLIGLNYGNKVYGADENGNVVVVIDPGHGGLRGESDDGAINGNIVERHINMIVAKAMYEELSKYNGVKVYLTHDSEDVSMSLRARSEFAKSVNADFLFSIHFNASELHGKYGSEVWIPSIGSYYVAGYQFADIELNELSQMGLFIRGIKTRIGDDGDEYYGIIRENEWRGINAVIIEHCYVDNKEDRRYIVNENTRNDNVGNENSNNENTGNDNVGNENSNNENTGNDNAENVNIENLEKFGKLDATAVAKYFGLKSTELGVDYSDYKKLDVAEPQERVYPDNTPPEKCSIYLKYIGNNSITFSVSAKDSDSYINYYSYSLDGGKTFSELKIWNDKRSLEDTIEVTLSDINVDIGNLIVRVYNRDDVSSDSNIIELNGIMKQKSDKTDSDNRNSEAKSFVKDNRNTFIGMALIVCGIIITFICMKKYRR